MALDFVILSVEQCCIISFLMKEKVKPAEILRRLSEQYGGKTLSHGEVYDWCNKFSEGHEQVAKYVFPLCQDIVQGQA
jgi:hypothetical protein